MFLNLGNYTMFFLTNFILWVSSNIPISILFALNKDMAKEEKRTRSFRIWFLATVISSSVTIMMNVGLKTIVSDIIIICISLSVLGGYIILSFSEKIVSIVASSNQKKKLEIEAEKEKNSQTETIVCSCGHINNTTASFCSKCGKQIRCLNCGNVLEPADVHCSKCETKVE